MSEFRPVFPAHAIERCSATVVFDANIPMKLFSKLTERVAGRIQGIGLRRAPNMSGFNFDAATGQVISIPESEGPAVFATPDGSQQLVITPNSINYASQQYIRWASFINQFLQLSAESIVAFEEAVSQTSVRLEYWDRFIWTGDWSTFDLSKLIDSENGFISKNVARSQREWHNHSGWFEYSEQERRLTNLNVDVAAVALGQPNSSNVQSLPPQVSSGTFPSVGVYTMMEDQAAIGYSTQFSTTPVVERLNTLHIDLKKLIGNLLIRGMSKRIGLGV